MMRGIDISNWQAGLNGNIVFQNVDFVICKATEGLNYVDKSCDTFVTQAISTGTPFGFYHFARSNDPVAECDYFLENTTGYIGKGIPVLDWEDGQSVDWVNRFVRRFHEKTGIWPWIYANPWRFNQGGVEQNCARWVAAYPSGTPDLNNPPETDGGVTAWQYTSSGIVSGYNGRLDCNVFYGDADAWDAYAGKEDIVTDEDIQKIAERVWQVSQGSYTADRVYRCTSMLKAMCGIGKEDMSDPINYAEQIHAWTMGRLERILMICKGMVGIKQEDTSYDSITTPMYVNLSDADVERIAEVVAKKLTE